MALASVGLIQPDPNQLLYERGTAFVICAFVSHNKALIDCPIFLLCLRRWDKLSGALWLFLYSKTQTGRIMLIYSNGIVIMWKAACCAVCQASDRPVTTGMQHLHHRHFNNLTNESPARMMATAAFTSE